MGKPPTRILAGDRCERCGDGLLQGFQRPGCLCPQECLDLRPTFFDRGEIGRIRREVEQPDARGSTGVRDARHLVGFEIIHDEDLTWPELWHEYLLQKSQKDFAVGEPFDRHGRDQPLETQGAEHGHRAAPIDGLGRLRALAPGCPGVEAGHRLMAARCVDKDAIFRGEQLDGVLERGPLPLDVGPLLLGGAKRFFFGAGPVWLKPD